MTQLTITRIHGFDAWFSRRNDVIGLTGTLKGRITQTADEWYSFTIITTWGDELTFEYAQFERV